MCEVVGRVHGVVKRQFRMTISNVFIQKNPNNKMDEIENLIAPQSKNTSSIRLQKPATETYSEPDESSLYLHIQTILLIRPSDLQLNTEVIMY